MKISKSQKWLIFILMGIFLAIMFGYSEAADKTYGSVIVRKVVSVYNGDTFTVNIEGWPDIIGKSISIRIYGIDTPEMRGTSDKVKELALKAKALSTSLLLGAVDVELHNIRRGKYFRIVAEVYVDGESLAGILISSGLAKPYYGGTKPVW